MNVLKPSPDALLEMIKKKDQKLREGKLRIFIGMAAGVGKTYSMLSMAHQKLIDGVDVVVGAVETHGRVETLKVLEGLPVIPPKKIEYGNSVHLEMDLESILKRKPKLVLVDELAHTNVPGSKHPKRWQDVLEILENGIDVYSAINIQHIESKKNDIEGITDILIYETVPDALIERADNIEIVDLPPEDLLKRLKEGKVYLAEKAEQAANNFFKEEKLSALRQILLRYSADKVDRDLEQLFAYHHRDQNWKLQEKILLAVGHGPQSEKLVRITKQLTTKLKCDWVALYVDTGKSISQADQKTLSRNLDLARDLGAKVVTTSEVDLIKGIERVCKQFNITQLVIGKSATHRLIHFIFGGSFLDKLNSLDNDVTINLVRISSGSRVSSFLSKFNFNLKVSGYVKSSLYVVLLALINSYFYHYLNVITYRSIGFLFLLGVSLAGLLFRLGPTIWASILAVNVWNFFYIPPLFTFRINSAEDNALAFCFFFVATITGVLNSIAQKNQALLRDQEMRTKTLYQLSLEIIESQDKDQCIANIASSLSLLFKSPVGITIKNDEGVMDYFKKGEHWIFNQPKEWAVALLAFDQKKPAGKWTDTLPDVTSMFIPLVAKGDSLGVLALQPSESMTNLLVNEREILFTICSQLAIYLERELFHQSSLETEKLKKSEKLHQTLLNSVSHEIKTPLTAISGIAETLSSELVQDKKPLYANLNEAVERLKRVVDNILDISRLDSGALSLKEDWYDIEDLIDQLTDRLKNELKDFEYLKVISPNFPLVYIDGKLIEQVIENLFLNSIKYAKKFISLELVEKEKTWIMLFSDHGPGIPKEHRKQIFNKFFRLPLEKTGGTGLGLSIVKSIIDLHKGEIKILDNSKGLTFEIVLPKYPQPKIDWKKL